VGSIAGDLDVALCDASGKKAPVNLSQSGYANMNPTFLPDGQSVLWTSDRLGLRGADGTGGQMDLFIAHLTQEAYDAFRLARSGVDHPARPKRRRPARPTRPGSRRPTASSIASPASRLPRWRRFSSPRRCPAAANWCWWA
jgi:hypothetical protein